MDAAYSHEPFGPTVERLMAAEWNKSYRSVSAQAGITAGYLHHIVHGVQPVPSDDLLARIAAVFGHGPELFLEYRIRRIAAALAERPRLLERTYREVAAV